MELAQVKVEIQKPAAEKFWKTRWDFFTGGNGTKSGHITDLKETGCTLKTSEPIEFRRWIRMMIRDSKTNVCSTAVGRVVRCQNAFEASMGSEVTLYRFVVEFTYPLDLSRFAITEVQDDEDTAPRVALAAQGTVIGIVGRS
jgi:hypothetical protein